MNRPSIDMCHDLAQAATTLKRTSIGMLGMAVRLSEAGMENEAVKLLAMARDLNEIEDVTLAYTEELRSGIVARSSFN